VVVGLSGNRVPIGRDRRRRDAEIAERIAATGSRRASRVLDLRTITLISVSNQSIESPRRIVLSAVLWNRAKIQIAQKI
jgi:hypothetical protein